MQTFSCDYCKSEVFINKESFTQRLGIQGTKFSVVQCKRCKLVSLFPLPTERELEIIYDRYADRKKRIVFEKSRVDNVYPLKLKKLKRFAQGDRLLDIGAGMGTFVSMAIDFGFDAVGIEYEKGQCKKAQELFGLSLVNDKIENVYQNFRNLDVVNMHHVLEHVKSPREIFDILDEILKPGGVACIEVPNQFPSIISRLIRFPTNVHVKPSVNPLDHLYFFTAKTLRFYVNRHKFEIVEFSQFRPRKKKLPMLERIPKDLYRLIVQKTSIGGGSHFEMFLKKRVNIH